MNYTEALKYIESTGKFGSRPGLERISELCRRMGDPQKGMKYIHVAGTNGKGSFCSMMASVLRAAGYSVGLYTSPYVKRFNERMSVDGVDISDAELGELAGLVRFHADKIPDNITEFEINTAIAFEYFRRHRCDIVVLEVGMGGRLDATNIIEQPLLSVITGIALDHTAYLGDTVEQIAWEKAGIIKSGAPAYYGGEDKTAEAVIRARAEELDVAYYAVNYTELTNIRTAFDGTYFDFGGEKDFHINLLGLYQPKNAASVISAVKILRARGLEITESALREGLESAVWHARFEKLCSEPLVIYDGSHNPQGMEAATESIRGLFGGQKVNILTGVMSDKDYIYMAGLLAPLADRVYTVTPDNPRSLPAADYAEVFRSLGADASAYDSLPAAVAAAVDDCKKTNTPLIALGSLYMYAEFTSALDAEMGR